MTDLSPCPLCGYRVKLQSPMYGSTELSCMALDCVYVLMAGADARIVAEPKLTAAHERLCRAMATQREVDEMMVRNERIVRRAEMNSQLGAEADDAT